MYLEARNLVFNRGKFSLQDVSFRAEEGTITGIGGRNGSGKSTLLRALYGFHRITSGDVVIGGKSLTGMGPREISRRISVVSQEVSEPFNFTVGEVVSISGYSLENEKSAVRDVLEVCGIGDLEKRPFNEISGGERRLALIAAAIYQDADILLLDEPTAFLDVDKEIRVIDILRKLRDSGKNIIVVLHDVNLLYRICDRVVLIRDGRIVASGPRDDVMTIENLDKTYSVEFTILEGEGPYRFAAKYFNGSG
ncbi:MAG: ABC transporter ATP-binding protein [Cuniculiplasma divulgatum]|jgi:iron complex transport system ATP-binding protein|nr:MAG: ABC transporter ATP-binding protein [Cuniculiplasma divulgatum]